MCTQNFIIIFLNKVKMFSNKQKYIQFNQRMLKKKEQREMHEIQFLISYISETMRPIDMTTLYKMKAIFDILTLKSL